MRKTKRRARKKKPRVDPLNREIARLFKKGGTMQEIAEAVALDASNVSRRLSRMRASGVVPISPRGRSRTGPSAPEPLEVKSIYELIEKLSPKYQPPRHLEPLPSLLERAPRGHLRVVVAIPVRHGKSDTVHHAIVRWLLEDPTLEIVYATYGARFAFKQARKIRTLAERAGIRFREDFKTIEHWQTHEGGGVLSTSVDGPLIGMGADILVIDDPYKNRAEAENAEHREKIKEWFDGTAMSRLSPTASVILVMSRWHEEDLSGNLIAEGWEHVHKRAIETDDKGVERALWPEMRPLEWLHEQRKRSEYDFASLYQGEPRPKDGALFKQPMRYKQLPTNGFRVAFGCDFFHSTNPGSDWFSLVKLIECGEWIYIADVGRIRGGLQLVEGMFRSMMATSPGAPIVTYASGKDYGMVKYFVTRGIPIQAMQAKTSKYVRSQPFLSAWNGVRDELGRVVSPAKVLLPEEAPWLETYLKEHFAFKGTDTQRDDQVDGGVAAFDFLQMQPTTGPRALGSRRM